MRAKAKLSTNFRALEYKLVDKSLTASSLCGQVIIKGHKIGPLSRRLTFHQQNLKIKDAIIIYHGKKGLVQLRLTRIIHHKSYQQVRLHTEEMIYPGIYEIKITYCSSFRPAADFDGVVQQRLASGGTREIFPSIDEPPQNAKFTNVA